VIQGIALFGFIVFNATFNNISVISWRSVLLVEGNSSIGASHQISIHLAKQFQRRRFKEIDQPETRIAYGSRVC
jgi:hypothetical protein